MLAFQAGDSETAPSLTYFVADIGMDLPLAFPADEGRGVSNPGETAPPGLIRSQSLLAGSWYPSKGFSLSQLAVNWCRVFWQSGFRHGKGVPNPGLSGGLGCRQILVNPRRHNRPIMMPASI